jgi:uncharacterized protein (TIGR02453 family)
MPFAGFSESSVGFLSELSRNDDLAWFEAHREECERVLIEPAKAFVLALGARLRALDPEIRALPRVSGSIHAMQRRRRFPRQGTKPFRDSLDVWFWSGPRRAWDNSGFFVRLGAVELVLACGMIEFQKPALARYREHVLDAVRGTTLDAIVSELRGKGYVLGGESYKRTPHGVPVDHPRATLLRHSGLFATLRRDHPEELGTPEFVDFAFDHFENMSKLHQWLVALSS